MTNKILEGKTTFTRCMMRLAPFHHGHWQAYDDRELIARDLYFEIEEELLSPDLNKDEHTLLLPDIKLSTLLPASGYVWNAISVNHAKDLSVFRCKKEKVQEHIDCSPLENVSSEPIILSQYIKNALEFVILLNEDHYNPLHRDNYLLTLTSCNVECSPRIASYFVASMNQMGQLEMIQYKDRGSAAPITPALDKKNNLNKIIL